MRSALILPAMLTVAFLAVLMNLLFLSPVETTPITAGLPSKILPPARITAKPLDEAQDRSLASFQETTQRPLFSASRRPVPPKENAIESAAPREVLPAALTNLRLVGIMRKPAPSVLIRANGIMQGNWIEVGQEVEGLRVQAVSANSVTVVMQNRKYELLLHPAREVR
jgi:hypothetical protein